MSIQRPIRREAGRGDTFAADGRFLGELPYHESAKEIVACVNDAPDLRARVERAEHERSDLRHHLGILVAHLLTMDGLPTTLRQRAEDAAEFLKRTAGEESSRG